MKHSLRLTLALSATVFFVSACSNTPYEDPSETGSTSNIPEAGPLTSGGYSGNYTQPQPGGGSAYYPPQTAQPQQPQYGAGYAQGQGGQPGNGYDTYASGSYDQSQGGQQDQGAYDMAGTTGGYDYSGGGSNDTYDSYSANTSSNNNSGGDYYANNSSGNSGGNDYYSGGGGGIGRSSGRAAVRVFGSGSSSKAQQVRSSMASRGLNAVVDSVDGLYKVRIPFSSESEARSNLMRVRSASGESGAFVTFR
ncbi:MAG: SPOR domain-containing protein [Thiothrix sp.]|nr:MAG: SPOR domain-containing protein [Thiothrix sp.]